MTFMETRSQPHVVIVAASLDILGGQSVQAHALVEALTRDGHQVMFIPINPRFPRALRWLRRVRYLRTLANQILYFPSLFSLSRADVVHVFSASYASFLLAPVPALVVARVLNKRIVLHYHSGEAADHLAHWGVLVHPWLRLADVIVVPSEYLADVFARHGYHTRVIPNLVDLSRFEYRARQPIRPRLLSTRNLEPYYRVDLILDAFALVRAEQPDATLTVAGFGSEESRLRRVAGEGVRFIGKVDPQSMPQVYTEADIFLNASVVDNQPVSILEAFAAGLPVVSTPAGDIPAMVRHNHTGLIVGPDAASLASAVLQLITHPRKAFEMAQQARQDVTRYTWRAVREQWAAAYAGPRDSSPFDHTVLPRESEPWTSPSTP
jgi:glycosyltransferase involved in cell wall biosynthesis